MNKFIIGFFLIVLAAIFLRFYQLGSNPPSLTWDEASLGYNAYSILKSGKDEYGTKFPLSFRSFDDYKPPLYVYLTVPSVGLFGLNEFSVRLPAAIIGVFSVVAVYFLTKEILKDWDKKYQELIALASSLFLAISPWSLQFSRAAFEGNVGLFFLMLGILLFFKSLRSGKLTIFSSLSFALSIYSYHSFRLLIPLFLLFLGLFFWRDILKKKLFFVIFFFTLSIFTLPVYLSFFKSQDSGSRLSMVSIFSDSKVIDTSIKRIEYDKTYNQSTFFDNRRIAYGLAIAKGYLDHFNPDFLFIHGDGGVQHHAVDMGMLYLWDIPFVAAGLYLLFRRRNRYIAVLFALFLLAPIPAAITTGTPHPVRAITLMPLFHIFAAVGLVFIVLKTMSIKRLMGRAIIVFLIIGSLVFNFMYYTHQYYVHTPIEYGYFWQYGYKEAFAFALENESKFDKIIVTYKYDQPYIYYLFYNKIDPVWYHENWDYRKNGMTDRFKRVIGKYTFENIDYSKDSLSPKTLFIGTPEEIPDSAHIIKVIKFQSGKIAFKIAKT